MRRGKVEKEVLLPGQEEPVQLQIPQNLISLQGMPQY
jgi:hypothetical protein